MSSTDHVTTAGRVPDGLSRPNSGQTPRLLPAMPEQWALCKMETPGNRRCIQSRPNGPTAARRTTERRSEGSRVWTHTTTADLVTWPFDSHHDNTLRWSHFPLEYMEHSQGDNKLSQGVRWWWFLGLDIWYESCSAYIHKALTGCLWVSCNVTASSNIYQYVMSIIVMNQYACLLYGNTGCLYEFSINVVKCYYVKLCPVFYHHMNNRHWDNET